MASKILAVRSYYEPTQYSDDSQEIVDIINWLNESVINLVWVLGQIVSNKSNQTAMVPDYQFATARLDALGKMCFDISVNEQSCADRSIIELTKLIDINKNLVQMINANSPIKNYTAYKLEEDNSIPSRQWLSKVIVDTPPICPQCNEYVLFKNLANHMKDEVCKRDVDRSTATKSGYVPLTADDDKMLAELVATKTILHRYIPYGYDIWVKRWVVAAIDSYNQNDGFAGMSLTDYLDKLADEQKD